MVKPSTVPPKDWAAAGCRSFANTSIHVKSTNWAHISWVHKHAHTKGVAVPPDTLRTCNNFIAFKKVRKKKSDLAAGKIAFQGETLFPGCTEQTKLTASLLKMCLEQSSKMINRASIFHKGLTFRGAQADKRHYWPEKGGELQARRTPMCTHAPLIWAHDTQWCP